MHGLYFNQTPAKVGRRKKQGLGLGSGSGSAAAYLGLIEMLFHFQDVALAMVSMRGIPLGPMMEKLSLSAEKYGNGRRFYIQTLDDHALSPDVQEKLVRENPPQGVFKIKGSDHCPFFSKPHSLHKILIEIAQIP